MLTSRSVTQEDRTKLAEWIAADQDHSGQPVDFWLPGEEKVQHFAIQDDQGDVFFVRAENLLRLHIQFAPDQRARTAAAISAFTPWVANGAKKNKYKQIIFESVFQPLIRFLGKRGFRSSPNEFVLDL